MGMYTYFVIKGTVKEQYRQKIKQLIDYYDNHDDNKPFEKAVDDIRFDLFKDFKTGQRSSMIFYGSVDFDKNVCEYNETTGEWHIECDIKNYPEDGKEKNSMDMFKDLIPELFEEGMFFSELYEEFYVPSEYELRNGELVLTNAKKVWEERENFRWWCN